MILLLRKYLNSLLLVIFLLTSVSFAQSQPYLTAPIHGSTWELTTPTLYWWYVSSPYSVGPFNYTVQVSSSQSNFTPAYLLVNADVTGYGTGSYTVNTSAGLLQGVTYFWRVGVGDNYSAVWSFTPYNYGGITTYNITAVADPHGTISPSGTISAARGSSRTFTITADAGYSILDLLVDNVSAGAQSSYSFTNITAPHSLRATFKLIPKYDTVYVSMLGHDVNGDGTRFKPYRKIQRGHDRSNPNGIVYVFNGTYEEDIVLTKPIKVIGQTNPSTRSFLVRANDITIKNFNVTQSSPGPGIQKVGLETYDHLDNLLIENVSAYNNAELGLLLININNVEVKNCRFYGNAMGGIAFINCEGIKLSNIFLEDNLRGFAAYNSNNISIDQMFVEDNGKAYLALFPDKNGLTFSVCNNITLKSVTSNKNQEQGMKFEDCSAVTLGTISVANNLTDGMAFIQSDHITINTATASSNGTTVNDNGIELIACDNIKFTGVSANENFNTGILFDLFYFGVYKWNPAATIPTPLPTTYYGPSTEIEFNNVTASWNGKHGLYAMHFSYGTFTNLTLTNNLKSGFEIDAAHHISLVGGTFDNNYEGIVLKPTVNTHPIAPVLSTDEITNFSLTGTASISNNKLNGIVLAPTATTKITEPLFYGKFNVRDNYLRGIQINGKVKDPIFSGLYLKGANSLGIEIYDGVAPEIVSGVKISNSYFDGYNAAVTFFPPLPIPPLPPLPPIRTAAISVTEFPLSPLYSAGNVDAKNNIFVSAADQAAVDGMIADKSDLPPGNLVGLVTTTGWTSGQPTIKIGSASAYTGSTVTIPIQVDISALPLSFSQLFGKIKFNELHLKYKYTTYGTGTIIHDAGWGTLFNHTTSDELSFMAFGFSPINTSGVLFFVTFEVIDVMDGSENVTALTADWSINGGTTPFVISNGKITYSLSSTKSLVKGDATLNFTVDTGDYIAVVNHVNGILLLGQALLNADVNKDSRVDELDAADILSFLNNSAWPGTALSPMGELLFASATINQNGVLRFPITFNNSSNIRSLQVELKYDESKIDYRSFLQMQQGKDIFVEAQKISNGVLRLVYTSANKTSGNLVPAELFFNLKSGFSTAGLIKSTYSINGGTSKVGPTYGASSLTDISEERTLPVEFEVEQNYPNPFNPSTTIKYSIPNADFVTVKIYDILGRLVNTLVNTEMVAGKHQVMWNGDNNSGAKAASGTYFYQVKSGNNIISKKMLLMK